MIKNLQILRAIAALLVVFFHCDFLQLKVGQFGVDIFFVISGYIISYVLNKKQHNFLIKRFIRVVPMYYLFTISVIAIWLIFPSAFKNIFISAESIIKSLGFIPYSLHDSGPILSLGWTLNYEIYFYVLVGIFSLLIKRPSIALLLTAFVIISIVTAQSFIHSDNFFIQYYGYIICVEFTFGILLFYIIKNAGTILHSSISFYFFALLALISFALMCYFDFQKIYWNRTILFGIPAFFIVLFFIISENRIFANNYLHDYLYQIGNASYVVYLSHPFIIFFIIRLVKPHLPNGLFFSCLELCVMLSSVMVFSNWVHKKVELPIVKYLEGRLHSMSA
jgi:peptidoglycan/LPS O-acetylase OafA/YrhL